MLLLTLSFLKFPYKIFLNLISQIEKVPCHLKILIFFHIICFHIMSGSENATLYRRLPMEDNRVTSTQDTSIKCANPNFGHCHFIIHEFFSCFKNLLDVKMSLMSLK